MDRYSFPTPPRTSWPLLAKTLIGKRVFVQGISTKKDEEMELTDFGWAIRRMKEGKCVARSGWNGKDMFIFIRNGRRITNAEGPMLHVGGVEEFESLSHICMRSATGELVVGWLASQTDMLATDWELVESIQKD